MTLQADSDHAERAPGDGAPRRALADGELENRLVAAERALAELRRQLHDVFAWRDALDAEKDRRSVQRRAERPWRDRSWCMLIAAPPRCARAPDAEQRSSSSRA